MSLSSLQLDSTGEFDLLYNFFYVRDYRNIETYETFALPFTPLYFIPNLNDGVEDFISNKRLVWSFGDGTTVESITASHAYDTPGRYKVTCYLFDENGTGYLDTFSSKVEIKDYIEDNLNISVSSVLSATLSANTGQLENPITVERFNSYRSLKSGIPSIVAYSSAGTDNDYFRNNYNTETYGHLKPYSSFVQKLTSSEVVEAIEVDNITTENTPIYIKLSSTEIIPTTKADPEAFYAGLTGTADVYFKSDYSNVYNLIFGYKQGDIFENVNTTNYGVSSTIVSNNTYDKLSFTSNGLDGEGLNSSFTTFNIGSTKFATTKIAFVTKVKDVNNFTQKNMPLLSASNGPKLNVVLTDGSTNYDIDITSNFQDLSTLDTGGFYKGYFISNNSNTLENVYLSGHTTYSGNVISGASSKFTIYPSSFYTISKKGENIDFNAAFKDIAEQPLFTDARVLMSDFLGSIFGNLSSSQDSIGKATYEKIQNFFDNNTSIDESNVEELDGILQMLNLPELNKYSFPPKLKRLIDLLSISRSQLFGRRNRNQTHYQSYGYKNNEFYGYNLGDKLDASSIIVTDQKIVASEKYSGKFSTLNTTLPIHARTTPFITTTTGVVYGTSTGQLVSATSVQLNDGTPITQEQFGECTILTEGEVDLSIQALSSSSQYYSLSDYNSSWGWQLLTGDGRGVLDVYDFYYQKDITTDIENSIIDFSDPNNTISYNLTSYDDWSKNDGTMSNIFSQSLYEGLNLFED
ncbi:PKD domain-containing protein [bacterium]|nr:PKD domain-containing protein [bacterium]